MWWEKTLERVVVLHPQDLKGGGKHMVSVVEKLMRDLEDEKCSGEHGYYVTPTTVFQVSQGRVLDSGSVAFTLAFRCLLCKLCPQEVVDMEVREVRKVGVLGSVGPVTDIFLHQSYMTDFSFEKKGEEPACFKGVDGSVIREGSVIRARLLKVEFQEAERSIRALATINGDFLGEISPP